MRRRLSHWPIGRSFWLKGAWHTRDQLRRFPAIPASAGSIWARDQRRTDMNAQFLADGLIMGGLIALGAIGVTLTYSILRFANFAHGEFISWGAYVTLVLVGAINMIFGASGVIGSLSFGWPVVAAGFAAALLTGLLALGLDRVLFS